MTGNLLAAALLCDDLDAAIAPIQKALGIGSGDIAGLVFDSHRLIWPRVGRFTRARLLALWIDAELDDIAIESKAEASTS